MKRSILALGLLVSGQSMAVTLDTQDPCYRPVLHFYQGLKDTLMGEVLSSDVRIESETEVRGYIAEYKVKVPHYGPHSTSPRDYVYFKKYAIALSNDSAFTCAFDSIDDVSED